MTAGASNGEAVDPDCPFCGIVAGTVPAHEVHRDDHAVAFLDRAPLFPGHTLVVPPAHHRTLTDLPVADVGPFFERVRLLTAAVRSGTGAAGAFVAANNVVSQSVPHLHVHVVPRNPRDGLRGFFWPRQRGVDDAELARIAERLRRAVSDASGAATDR